MEQRESTTVFVGLSGGVDSSVAAARLLKVGYRVVGVFIKTWAPDFLPCSIEADRLDAMRVAAKLNIPFLTFDAEAAYKQDVADYMIAEYKAGRTPNPDVMCNKYVKFGAFLDFAEKNGAHAIATGHYAQVKREGDRYRLYRGGDEGKDQSYFLWTLTQSQLKRSLFPVGDTEKTAIRREATRYSLPTAQKSDSQGICFLGEVDMREFLSHYIEISSGDVLDPSGTIIGKHSGALLYTLGQRHGFTVTGSGSEGRPLYVIKKDLEKNTITVADIPPKVEGRCIQLTDVHMIDREIPGECEAQFRYRQQPFPVSVRTLPDGRGMLIDVRNDTDLPAIGQSCVLYDGNECLGGGIISAIL